MVKVSLVSALSDRRSEPLGLMTLAAVGRQRGIDTLIHPLPLPREEASFLEGLKHRTLLGFSTLCNTYPRSLRLAALAKRENPGLLVALGGPQATVTARRTLERFPFVDLVVKGEAENAWLALLRAAGSGRDWSGVPGAVYRAPGGIVENDAAPLVEDLDSLPMPDYASLSGFSPRANTMEIGRGCPYTCTFCSTSRFFKRSFRMKSPERIVAEAAELNRRFGTRHFDFIHDMFAARRSTVVRFCELLRGTGFTWGCSARTDCLDASLVDTMAGSGCRGIYFGLETGSQPQQKRIGKRLDIVEAVQMARLCQGKGLAVTASFIIGFPDESPGELRDTLLCALELLAPHPRAMITGAITVQLHLYAPLAGTALVKATAEHAFDGNFSNIVRPEGEDALLPEELRLAASDFELFSAFHYPVRTAVPRTTLLAVTEAFERLAGLPEVRSHLTGRLRLDFVDFLLDGGFSLPDLAALPPAFAGSAVLSLYAAQRARDFALAEAMDREMPGRPSWEGPFTGMGYRSAGEWAGPARPPSGRGSPWRHAAARP